MKAKITRGGGFRGALDYVLDQGPKATGNKNPEIVGGNLAGQNPREMSREFAAVRKLRPDIGKPVWHCSLALPPGDRLAAEKWDEIATDFMATLGFPADTPYTAVRHQDTDKDHIHIVASRVSLSGEVWLGRWEARRAIEATQELEKRHGLTLTPGLGDARAEKKALTRGEINMAFNTGVEPPRQRLRRIVDEAVKNGPGALTFVERLQEAGVSVRPNLASTGRLNGFSFEIDGVPMKGQDLGKAYTWGGLQKRGVTYEQTRDRAGLEQQLAAVTDSGRGEAAAADHSADERQNIAAAGNNIERDSRGTGAVDIDQPRAEELAADDIDGGREGLGASAVDQSRIAELAAEDIDRDADSSGTFTVDQNGAEEFTTRSGRGDSRGTGTAETDQPGVIEFEQDQGGYTESVDGIRQDIRSTAPDTGNLNDRAGEPNQGSIGPDLSQRGNNRRHEDDSRKYGHEHRDGDRENRRSRDESIQHSSRQPAEMVDPAPSVDDHRSPGRSTRDDWSSRFKQASAAKRDREKQRPTPANNQQSDSQRNRVAQQNFKQIDPTAYLESQGFTVKREGRHLSAQVNGDEMYRITEKPDGKWLWCDRYGERGGDNISLVQEIQPGTRYSEAVYQLSGGASVHLAPRPAAPPRVPPSVPEQNPINRLQGREYLQSRGISQDTLDHAEKAGMVQYVDKAVLFVGRDQGGQAQNITRRAIKTDDPVQKRDFRGSDKSYPPILPGDPAEVWIVEGGADALALHDMARRSKQPPPTVIVSGGANVRSFMENPEVQEILRRAKKITVGGENEKDKEAQDRADQGHKRQAEKAGEITGGEVQRWTPPPEAGKDLADYNVRWQTQELIRKNREQNQQQPEQEHSWGPSLGR